MQLLQFLVLALIPLALAEEKTETKICPLMKNPPDTPCLKELKGVKEGTRITEDFMNRVCSVECKKEYVTIVNQAKDIKECDEKLVKALKVDLDDVCFKDQNKYCLLENVKWKEQHNDNGNKTEVNCSACVGTTLNQRLALIREVKPDLHANVLKGVQTQTEKCGKDFINPNAKLVFGTSDNKEGIFTSNALTLTASTALTVVALLFTFA